MSRFAHQNPEDPEAAMEREVDRADCLRAELERDPPSPLGEVLLEQAKITQAVYTMAFQAGNADGNNERRLRDLIGTCETAIHYLHDGRIVPARELLQTAIAALLDERKGRA